MLAGKVEIGANPCLSKDFPSLIKVADTPPDFLECFVVEFSLSGNETEVCVGTDRQAYLVWHIVCNCS